MPNTREKLIDLRQEAEKIAYNFCVGQEACDKCPYHEPKGYQEGMIADHLIANGVTVQKWIPVTERLPEEKELVLILCKNGAMFVGYCGMQYADFERRWRIKTALNSTRLLNLGRVTHWMPLPEAPKEVE